MENTATRKEREGLLKARAKRLQFFAETFDGRPNWLIETTAYSILETYQPRRRAIWKYIRYAFRQWRASLKFEIQFAPRVWYYTRIKGLDHRKAVDLACDAIEERYYTAMKER